MAGGSMSPMQWAFSFGGMAVGVVISLTLGYTVLPQGVLWFALYGGIGGGLGGALGQIVYKLLFDR